MEEKGKSKETNRKRKFSPQQRNVRSLFLQPNWQQTLSTSSSRLIRSDPRLSLTSSELLRSLLKNPVEWQRQNTLLC